MPEGEPSGLERLREQRRRFETAAALGPQFHLEAYVLVCQAVDFTCRRIGEQRHLSGPELVDGICDLAIERFGYLAYPVLERWGVTRTDDFGEIVFNLIDVGLLGKSDDDAVEDFQNLFDLRQSLRSRYRIDAANCLDPDD